MPSSEHRPYLDEDGRTDAETYLTGVLDGSIIAGKKIVKLAKKMLPRIRNGYKRWHFDVDAALRPVKFIERFCYLPSGTLGVPFILESYERMIVELTFGFVDDDGFRQFRYLLALLARKNGKCLSLDTEIPTPNGWTRMADIHRGDYVFSQDGTPSRVLVESEIFDKPMYLVTFEDGSTIKASGDHIWTVSYDRGDWCNRTTDELFGDIGGMEICVPLQRPVEYLERTLDHDPYETGVICGVTGEAIPDEYLTASVKQRWRLMDGIEYACGEAKYEDERWMVIRCGTDELASQVAELASSLGLCVGRNGTRVVETSVPGDHLKRIVFIEPIPNEPSKCIAIDHPSHLYLAGRGYTATHNTSLSAAIELYMLIADGEGAPQIYNVATSKAQASLGFGAVSKMVRQSPKLRKKIRRGKVIERAEVGLVCDGNLGYIIPCSKQTDHLDGLDVHGVVVDEMAAMTDRAVYDLLRQGMGARNQPLIIAITTEGFVRDNLWDAEHKYANDWLDDKLEEEDDRFLAILYEQDDKGELFGPEENWQKSNPGLSCGVKKIEYLRGEVIKAKNDPSYLPTVLTKDFNLRANAATSFLSYEEAYNHTKYEFDPKKFRYCVIGIDAADTLDLNAATALFMTPGDDHIYRRSMYWIAEEQVKVNSNNQKGRDGVPYDKWESQGYLRKVPGNKVDHHCFIDWIDELYDEGLFCVGIGYDRWHMDTIENDMKYRVGADNCMPIAFGAKSLSMPMKQLKADLRAGRIIDGDNPIDHWCNANVAAKEDVNGNIQPVKLTGPTSRIDGFAALLCAYKYLMENMEHYMMCIGG